MVRIEREGGDEDMMKVKGKISAFLLLTALAAVLFAGCSQGEAPEDSSGKGRYVEADMELPLETGEQLISFTESKDGNPLLFSIHYIVEDSVQMEVKRYEYIDGGWEGKAVEWFAEMYGGHISASEAVDMEEADDGTQVLVMKEQASYRHFLLSGREGEKGEELDIPYLSKQTGDSYTWVTDVTIDGKGNLWIHDNHQNIKVLSADTLETKLELETDVRYEHRSVNARIMGRGQDGSVAVRLKNGIYKVYDPDSLTERGSLKFAADEWPQLCSDENNWYGVSDYGISRTRLGSDISEIIMNPGMGTMGSPLYNVVSMVRGKDGEFYVLYKEAKDYTYSLKRYVYDPDISAVPQTTLTVFGLSKNDTVLEAIQGFQKKNPNVLVDYRTSGKSENEVTTDDIRALNTELLSGNGADLLLMDGLPLESYLEKGMLEDLTGLAEELMGNDAYMENMLMNTAQRDHKVYGLPVKFSVPVIYGDQEVQEALRSYDSLNAYLDKNPDASVFGLADHGYIKNIMFQLYQDEMIGTDHKIDQEKLAGLLEIVGKLCENTQTESIESLNHISAEDLEEVSSPFENMAEWGLLKYPNAVGTNDIESVLSMLISYEVMHQLKLSPASIRNLYRPVGVMAVNQNSGQKETAKEFMKYLFSEEVQSTRMDDGFPVLKSALDSQADEADSLYLKTNAIGGLLKTEEGDIEIMAIGILTREDITQLIDLSQTLTEPLKQDRIIWGIYQENAEKYLEGSIDAHEAARKIAQKADTYLAE